MCHCNSWIETMDGRFRHRADGILEVEHFAGAVQTLESVREMMAAIDDCLGPHAPVPILIRPGEMKGQERAARLYIMNDPLPARLIARGALLTSNPVSNVIGNFFIRVFSPIFPMQLFRDESKALAWLRAAQSSTGEPRHGEEKAC